MGYTIREVTQKYDITTSTLRYYEKEGLLPVINKAKNGQREYTNGDLEWLEIIICMRKTGMGIAYIKRYIQLCHQGDDTIKERYQIFLNQKKIIEDKMLELENNMKKINHKIDWYEKKMMKG